MVAVTLFGLVSAILVQGWRADRREAALRARLQVVEKQKAIARLALNELDAVRQQELNQLRSQVAQSSGRGLDAGGVRPSGNGKR